MARQYWNLTRRFLRQDIESRFRGNVAGVAWALIGPVLQLAVFFVVFVHIFKARVPGLEGPGYLAFLALGFWPWFAFSEAVTRATTAIPDNAGLIGKVALPRSSLVLARVLGAFVIHGVGFVAVLILLPLLGVGLSWGGLPVVILLWLPLFAMATGLGLASATLQVFVRDFAQIITHLLNIGFFLTPILFTAGMVPKPLQPLVHINPLTGVVQGTRDALMDGTVDMPLMVRTALLAVLVLAVGIWLFRRCDRYFEDVL